MKFLYGNKNNIVEGFKVFNFSSYCENYRQLNLIPPNNLGNMNEMQFDINYMNYILGVDINFMNFMSMIMEFYYSNDVYMIISEDYWGSLLADSLLKLIQQRYGINATYVTCPEDVVESEEYEFDPYYGISNFDIDRERYLNLVSYNKIISSNNRGY